MEKVNSGPVNLSLQEVCFIVSKKQYYGLVSVTCDPWLEDGEFWDVKIIYTWCYT